MTNQPTWSEIEKSLSDADIDAIKDMNKRLREEVSNSNFAEAKNIAAQMEVFIKNRTEVAIQNQKAKSTILNLELIK